jgi:hypothetical protein
MPTKFCCVCEFPFDYYEGEEWKTYCIFCYKKKKQKEEVKKEPQPRVVTEKIPEEIIFALIKLCHPDRHNNSKLSNDATKWLLEKRGKK